MIAKQRILKKSERQDMREDVKLMKGNEAIAVPMDISVTPSLHNRKSWRH